MSRPWRICTPGARGHAEDAGRLADLLGDDHDLGVLRQTLTRDHVDVAVDLDAVVQLIDHRRSELHTEAIHLGERVYAETPPAFARRMKRRWKAGRAAAQASLEQRPLNWRRRRARRTSPDEPRVSGGTIGLRPRLHIGSHCGHERARHLMDDFAVRHDDGTGWSLAGRLPPQAFGEDEAQAPLGRLSIVVGDQLGLRRQGAQHLQLRA